MCVVPLSVRLYLSVCLCVCLSAGSSPLLGDLLCVAGAVLYAINNVAQEYLVKNHSIVEYLGLVGVVGSFISGIQL